MRLYQVIALLYEDVLEVFLGLHEDVGVLSGVSSETLKQADQFLLHGTVLELFFRFFLPVTGVDHIAVNRKLNHDGFEDKQVIVKNVSDILFDRRVQFVHFPQFLILLDGSVEQQQAGLVVLGFFINFAQEEVELGAFLNVLDVSKDEVTLNGEDAVDKGFDGLEGKRGFLDVRQNLGDVGDGVEEYMVVFGLLLGVEGLGAGEDLAVLVDDVEDAFFMMSSTFEGVLAFESFIGLNDALELKVGAVRHFGQQFLEIAFGLHFKLLFACLFDLILRKLYIFL